MKFSNSRVLIPDGLMNNAVPCKLYGRYHHTTRTFNVLSTKRSPGIRKIGAIYNEMPDNAQGIVGIVKDGKVEFYHKGKRCAVEAYELYRNIFSRNKGILETDVMSNKGALIIGCGSVGSLVALELARSGVGRFLLVDSDMLEYHNVCRHQCGIDDVGDFKVNALKRRINNINPHARVITHTGIIEHIPVNTLTEFCVPDAILVGCADNRRADVHSNNISVGFGIPFVSVGFWERACAGEIFYWLPGLKMPCYECALGSGGEISERTTINNHHLYSNETDILKVKFEPGISVDINFVTTIGIKLIIDILNRNTKDYTPRLLNNLTQFTLVCNTSDPKIGGEVVEIFSYPLQVTTSLKVNFGPNCKDICRREKNENRTD